MPGRCLAAVTVIRGSLGSLAAKSAPLVVGVQQSENGGTPADIWGTVPAWLSAVLTGAAFGVTFLLFRRDRRDRIRRQAERVYAWERQEHARDGSLTAIATVY